MSYRDVFGSSAAEKQSPPINEPGVSSDAPPRRDELPRWNDIMHARHPTPYTGIPGWIERYRLRLILSEIADRADGEEFTLAEVGCGSGHVLGRLADRFPDADYYGIDISSHALDNAQENVPSDVNLLQVDVSRGGLPIDGLDVDFLVCSETIEHIPDSEGAMSGLAELASGDTTLILTVPIERYKNLIKRGLNSLGLFDLLFEGIERDASEWHVHDFSKEELLELVGDRFEVQSHSNVLLMHRMVVATPGDPDDATDDGRSG